ncbi:GSCFA domain-containing protein [Fulvivirga sediminis]|uniref:GSCFA domain-containing protein n=1 Tax=Fulvivirga sediminis TaxID=2803949 RepID=A0A937K0H9_9BACT|nr:GSCFA domain-containing protein [Fulvivirga sediminis]MBL3655572.1 GSCFA domain-containing protein [Fulvivirga sediminis]
MFRTEINIPSSPKKIDLSTPILSIGSCFSDCIGNRFKDNKFQALANPFGTVYNPISIFKLLAYSLNKEYPAEDTYISTGNLQANYDFHSSFSSVDKDAVAEGVKSSIDKTHSQLLKCKWLIITFGTSFIYRRKDNHEIVANCHKVPSKHFTKELLSQAEMIQEFSVLLKKLQKINPALNIILTVSPVRHIKDTLEQNSVSKSILRTLCHELSTSNQNIHYFPSYEIMMDDLRDYRFYKGDMIHPTEVAEDYIWGKFADTYFTSDTQQFLKKWSKLRRAIHHRPFNLESEEHQKFIHETINKLNQLSQQIDLTTEIEGLKKQIAKHHD